VRDEERGTRELPAELLGGPRRTANGVDGIPEQARPHPEDGAVSAETAPVDEDEREKLSGRGDGRRDPEGAAPSMSADGQLGVSPARS
jgi:RNA polymerase sigma-B factor